MVISRTFPDVMDTPQSSILDIAPTPSQPEVVHLWKEIHRNIDHAESLFAGISERLRVLRRLHWRGRVDTVRVDEVSARQDALWHWFRQIQEMIVDVGDLDMAGLKDGAGI